jgi:ubiquinone/menaquinone biosynthesis C-methylase UbiE
MAGEHEKSSAVSEYLAKREVHEQWERTYRTEANERFYEQAFDFIVGEFDSAPGRVLDAGCGRGFHSMRLAKRGFSVLACDFSQVVLEMARENVHAAGLDDKISFASEDILNLSFDDGSQDCVLCWGVLMHIPDVANAVAELSRVLKSGGTLVVGENNAASLQSLANRLMKKLLRRPGPKRTAAGWEYWQERDTGTLVTREADIRWPWPSSRPTAWSCGSASRASSPRPTPSCLPASSSGSSTASTLSGFAAFAGPGQPAATCCSSRSGILICTLIISSTACA